MRVPWWKNGEKMDGEKILQRMESNLSVQLFEPLITSLQAWLELLGSSSSFPFMIHLSSRILLICPQRLCGMSNKQLFTQFLIFIFFHPRSYSVICFFILYFRWILGGLDTSPWELSHRRHRIPQPFFHVILNYLAIPVQKRIYIFQVLPLNLWPWKIANKNAEINETYRLLALWV